MKKTEKELLEKAFGIPEPKRRDDFFQKLPEKPKQPGIKAIIYNRTVRMVSAAVMVCAVFGLIGGAVSLSGMEKMLSSQEETSAEAESPEMTNGGNEAAAYSPAATTSSVGNSISAAVTTAAEQQSAAVSSITAAENAPPVQTTLPRKQSVSAQTNAPEMHTTSAHSPVQTTVQATAAITQTAPPVTESAPPVTHDYTVQPGKTYTIAEKIIILDDTNSIDGPKRGTVIYPPDKDWTELKDQLFSSSQLIAVGRTEEVIYTDVYGMPYTQENIVLTNVIKGGLNSGDIISVYSEGGYMPLNDFLSMNGSYYFTPPDDDWDNYSVNSLGRNTQLPQEGDTCLLFLEETVRRFPEGSYTLSTSTDTGRFTQSGDVYVSNAQPGLTLTAEEINMYVDNSDNSKEDQT